jgi:hypothetical protein
VAAGGGIPCPRIYKTGTRRPRPREEWIAIPVSPIVTREGWGLVQERLAARAPNKVAPRLENAPTLLTGLATCGCCAGSGAPAGMRLRFVYRKRGPSLLVVDTARLNTRGLAAANRSKTGHSTAIVFLLVPQVTLRKRLNIDAIAKRQAARVPTLIARHWPR